LRDGTVQSAGETDHPHPGAVLALKRPVAPELPTAVSLPNIIEEGFHPIPAQGGGFLGARYAPFAVNADPNDPTFGVAGLTGALDVQELGARRSLLQSVNRAREWLQVGPGVEQMDAAQQRALGLLSSGTAQKAFDLRREPAPVRDAYGRNIYGQSVLLARRLIEAGTRVACVSWAPDANATWDTHGNNFVKLKNELLPQLDAALSSLLKDLNDRGMLRRTLVVVMGEFGRSPKVNPAAGRDHWNFCYSLLLAGGGIKPGVVHGSSDRIGGRPSSNPVTPADVVATIYHCLGIANDLELQDRLSRPFQLVPWGSPIRELLA
jgi:hypothetical protein